MKRASSSTKPWWGTASEYEDVSTAIPKNSRPNPSYCCQGCFMDLDQLLQHQVRHKEMDELLSNDKKDLSAQRDELNQAMSKAEQDHLTVQLLLKECDFINPTMIVPQKAFQQFNKMILYDADRSCCRELIQVEREKIMSRRQNLKGEDSVLTTQERNAACCRHQDQKSTVESVGGYPLISPPKLDQQPDLTAQDKILNKQRHVRKYLSLEPGQQSKQAYSQFCNEEKKEKNTSSESDRQNMERQKTRLRFKGSSSLAQRKTSVVIVSAIGFLLFLLVRFFPVQSNPQRQRDRFLERQQ